MREKVIETIDEHEYEFLQLGARKAFVVLNRLLKMTAPSLGKAAMSLSGAGLDAKVDENLLSDAVSSLGASLDENENLKTAEMLFSSVTYKGRAVSFETETFQGNLFHMIKVLKKAAEVNIGDFFSAFKGAAEQAAEHTGQVLAMSKASGSSGESFSQK